VKLTHVFAAYEFQASKSELYNLLTDAFLSTIVLHKDANSHDTEIGTVQVQLKELLQSPMKQTPNSMVRVSD